MRRIQPSAPAVVKNRPFRCLDSLRRVGLGIAFVAPSNTALRLWRRAKSPANSPVPDSKAFRNLAKFQGHLLPLLPKTKIRDDPPWFASHSRCVRILRAPAAGNNGSRKQSRLPRWADRTIVRGFQIPAWRTHAFPFRNRPGRRHVRFTAAGKRADNSCRYSQRLFTREIDQRKEAADSGRNGHRYAHRGANF